jgi:hypothetical protein
MTTTEQSAWLVALLKPLVPHLGFIKFALPTGLAVLVVVWAALAVLAPRVPALARKARLGRAVVTVLLVVAALLGSVLYNRTQLYGRPLFNEWEFYHYYIGTKYWRELGYNKIYNATLMAELKIVEDPAVKNKRLVQEIRDLGHSKKRKADAYRKNGKRWTRAFSPARFEAFTRDIRWFRDNHSARFAQMLGDRGYNATPIFTMVAGTIANALPIEHDGARALMMHLDTALLLVMVAAAWWAFGHRAALVMLLALLTHLVTSHAHLKGSFLRLDWITALVLATAFLHRRFFVLAGVCTAYAACIRVFPVFFVFGPAVVASWRWWTTRSLDRAALRFFGGFTATAAALVLLSWAATSTAYWAEFLGKIKDHSALITQWRIGWKILFVFVGNGLERRLAFFTAWQPAYWAVVFAVAVLVALAVRRRSHTDAFVVSGTVLFFFVTPAAYYYYVLLLVPALWLGWQLPRPLVALNLAWFFATAIVGHKLFDRHGNGAEVFVPVSWMIAAQLFLIFTMLAVDERRLLARSTAGLHAWDEGAPARAPATAGGPDERPRETL